MDLCKQMHRVPVLSALLLLLLAAVTFSACGNEADTSGLSGMWRLYSVDDGVVTAPESILHQNMLHMRLDPDGSGMLYGGDKEGRISWHYEQGELSVQTGTTWLVGYADESGLSLHEVNSDTYLHFCPEYPDEQRAETETALTDMFIGDWYGWWKIDESNGTMPISWYDCCANIAEQEDGTLLMTLWDEDGSRDEAMSVISFTPMEDGTLQSLNGYFLYSEVDRGALTLKKPSPAIYIAEIEHQNDREQFRASIYLRPWGDKWDDAPDEQKPFYYEDWYLPLLKKGAEMPDRIPWENLEENRAQPKIGFDAVSDGS